MVRGCAAVVAVVAGAGIFAGTAGLGAQQAPASAANCAITGTIVGLLASGTSADVVIPYGLILFREFAVSALRETTAGRIELKVTMLAKWKTTLQLVALGAQLLALIWTGAEDNWMPTFVTFADILVWVAALVTLWTGWQYFAKAREQMR